MSIEVTCLHCSETMRVNDRFGGRKMRCPHCEGVIEVPQSILVIQDEVAELDVASPAVSESLGTTVPDTLERSRVNAMPAIVDFDDDDDDDEGGLLPKAKKDDGELDMTPMVDVTFLLLIFFMITAAFSLQKSMESPRQQSDAPSTSAVEQDPEDLDQVTVQIDEFGSYLVLAADWERETPGKQNLILALREALGEGNIAMKLAIEVHEAAKLQALVDCMDAGTICDYGEMQVTQVEGFDD